MPESDRDPDAIIAARAAHAKGGEDIVILEVGPVMGVCDRFVIASASNPRLVKAVAEHVEERVGVDGGPRPIRVEGLDSLEWVLLDYGDIVVHVFLDEVRRHYDLERLWSDVDRVAWQPDPVGDPMAESSGEGGSDPDFE